MTETDEGHPHRCREGHTWQHTGPSARTCRIQERVTAVWGRAISPEDCPLCTGSKEVLLRGRHAHRCPLCDGPWMHEGRCARGESAQCPWCFPSAESQRTLGMRSGPHRHDCPRCLQMWRHTEPCDAALRSPLPECPGCRGALNELEPADQESRATSARRAGVRGRRGRRLEAVVVVLVGGAVLGVTLSRALAPPRSGLVPPGAPAPPLGGLVTPRSPAPPSVPPPVPFRKPGPSAIVSGVTPSSPALPPRPAVTPSTPQLAPAPGAERKPPSRAEPDTLRESAIVSPPGARPAPVGAPVEECRKPSTAAVAFGLASGKPLGLWVDVEIGRDEASGRCFYVIQRPDDVRWVIDSSRVRIAPR